MDKTIDRDALRTELVALEQARNQELADQRRLEMLRDNPPDQKSGRTLRRVTKELLDIRHSPVEHIVIERPTGEDDDLLNWAGSIRGPPDSPYDDGLFKFSIQFPSGYPMKAPGIVFHTPIYHPSIKEDKNVELICFMPNNWCTVLTASKFLLDLVVCLNQPESGVARIIVPEVDEEMKEDRDRFEETARKWTREFAE